MMASTNKNASALSLMTLYEVSKILTSSLDLERMLAEVLNLLASYLGMRLGTVCLANGGGGLDVIAAAGMNRDMLRKAGIAPPHELVGRILSSGMPMVIPNLADEPMSADWQAPRGMVDGEIVSFIGVPIRTAEKTIGVLSIDRIWDHPGQVHFEADVRFLTMVANLIGATVRLHQSVASDRERLIQEKQRLQKAVQRDVPKVTVDHIIGVSRRMQHVYSEVRQIAPSRSTVLLRGESGTGKELVARALHSLSTRKDGPFVKLNCAALPETLLESELFGHEKGAFTGATQERKGRFELANGGTLFLDEIGEISASFQAKLLRVLQEGEFERVGGSKTLRVDVRLVAATNRNLEEAVAKGEFRADLYYRINVVPLLLPALRERREDIPLLIDHFLRRFNVDNNRSINMSSEALDVMCHCNFPGNVRELENCVQRVATMSRGEVVRDVDLPCQRNQCLSAALWKHSPPPFALAAPTPAAAAEDDAFPMNADEDAEDLAAVPQRDKLVRAMEKAGWVQAKAARLLGLTPRQIGYALKKYNIEMKKM